ncbi:MAG TPA: hypothetical protein VFE59_35650, partial [Trebonia sp.]|nr:hypothetical protein [Trebonia sp.]
MPNSSPSSSGRQYSPDGKSNTIGVSANAGCTSVTATWCRAPPAGMRMPASAPTAASFGPPVRITSPAEIV